MLGLPLLRLWLRNLPVQVKLLWPQLSQFSDLEAAEEGHGDSHHLLSQVIAVSEVFEAKLIGELRVSSSRGPLSTNS